MYIFRRAAARAISAPRQIRPVTRTTSFQSSIPSIARSFHQSRSFLAEEEQKKEAGSSPQQDAVSESSGTTSEPLGQSEHQSENQQSVSEQASELADKAKSTVSEAAETVAGKASSIPAQAQESFSNASENVRSAASSARQAADQFNPFQQQPAKSTTLYIGNLFFEVTAPQLESEFAKIGEVSRSRIVTDDRGLSKGFGYIEFATQEDADEAINALHDKVFQGRRMNVQYHRRRDPNRGGAGGARNALDKAAPKDPSKTLFIGNMSYQMSDKDLNDLFRQIRNVLDVRVAIDRRSGQPRGFAHADFIDVESATAAKEILEQKSVYGRQLRVDYSGRAEHGQGRGGRDGGNGASRFS